MPYTDSRDRKHIGEEQIRGLVGKIKSVPSGKLEANCVYVCCRIVLGVMMPRSWTNIAHTKGIFNECKDEVNRRLMGKREDAAIEKSGDLTEFKGL